MQFTARQIADLVKGTVDGDPEALVNTFAKIEEGHPGALSFLANPKYTPHIYDTRSSVVLVRRDFEPERPVKATLIRVDDPYATVAHLLKLVSDMTAKHPTGREEPSHVDATARLGKDCYVGAFAYIGPDAVIGDGVKIYPQTYVGAGVTIGDGTILYPGVKIYHGCRVGRRCTLHSGVVVGADGFGFAPEADGTYSKIPQIGIVDIADDVEVGANTTIDRATMGATRVGRGTKLDNLIQIAHNVVVGTDTVMAAQAGIAGSTTVGNRCMIGGQVGLAGHIHMGDGAQIAAQSGTPDNIPAGARMMGSPAIDARQYMRQFVYLKRLPELFAQLSKMHNS